MGGLNLITGPTAEPLSVTTTKEHLRVEGTLDDSFISKKIVTARRKVESYTGLQFIKATWEWSLDSFRSAVLRVPYPPLIVVNSIKYTDTDGVVQTWASSNYDVDTISQPGRITPAFGELYPDTRVKMNAVIINFDAGFGIADDVPSELQDSMLNFIGGQYTFREPVIAGAAISKVPDAWESLARPYRRFWEI